jgi:hypothetical protein
MLRRPMSPTAWPFDRCASGGEALAPAEASFAQGFLPLNKHSEVSGTVARGNSELLRVTRLPSTLAARSLSRSNQW